MSGRREVGEDAGWALLERAPEVRLAGVVDGRPTIRTMHPAVHDRALWFHGVPHGTLEALEGARVSVQAEEIVARIPSWMRHPERACPATTYYRSALVEGILRPVTDPAARAAALQRMMEVLQPEGRHRPITADDPLYAGAVRGLGVWSVIPEQMSAVEKLGQDQTVPQIRGILRGLWARGGEGDLRAIEQITAAHPGSASGEGAERVAFADLPDDLRPRCFPSEADVEAAVALVRGQYWNRTLSDGQLAEAVRHSAWVGLSRDGALVATARAISDRAKRSWIYDVAVSDRAQRRGLGTLLMGLMLDHPAVRGTEVNLQTRDAAPFYRRLGFEEVLADTRGPWPRTWMRRA